MRERAEIRKSQMMQQGGFRGESCFVDEDLEKPKFDLKMRHDRKASPIKEDAKEPKKEFDHIHESNTILIIRYFGHLLGEFL
ncbi:hypothetical protein CDAR_474901 [Caerostris darwini]|uniref:Uncharacterized protein n=1 Tax=Caerostris darwini TaxID=1538125 RepID=A0AAV4MTF3_9ARAC|nr:hypothetical protein CDAR_474901 [Caerostris darwini]